MNHTNHQRFHPQAQAVGMTVSDIIRMCMKMHMRGPVMLMAMNMNTPLPPIDESRES